MTKTDTSLQTQNPISSAQNAVENVHRAVSSALSHPTQQTLDQAQNAINKAEKAVDQATMHSDAPPAQQVAQELSDEEARLQNLQ